MKLYELLENRDCILEYCNIANSTQDILNSLDEDRGIIQYESEQPDGAALWAKHNEKYKRNQNKLDMALIELFNNLKSSDSKENIQKILEAIETNYDKPAGCFFKGGEICNPVIASFEFLKTLCENGYGKIEITDPIMKEILLVGNFISKDITYFDNEKEKITCKYQISEKLDELINSYGKLLQVEKELLQEENEEEFANSL